MLGDAAGEVRSRFYSTGVFAAFGIRRLRDE
jgi:hypothetical protein